MDWITNGLYQAAEWALSALPDSPFIFLRDMQNSVFYQFIRWLNWFIPVGAMVSILAAWCAAILVYYIFQIVLRWAKAIE